MARRIEISVVGVAVCLALAAGAFWRWVVDPALRHAEFCRATGVEKGGQAPIVRDRSQSPFFNGVESMRFGTGCLGLGGAAFWRGWAAGLVWGGWSIGPRWCAPAMASR